MKVYRITATKMFAMAVAIYSELSYREKQKFLKEFSRLVLHHSESMLHSIGDDYINIVINE